MVEKSSMTEMEWTIMNVVWESEPCAAGTVQEALQESRGWAYSTVKTTMDRMVKKGLLTTHAIRNLNLFRSKVTKKDAQRGELHEFLRRAFDGSMTPMLQFLMEEDELSDAEIDQLRKLIRNSKR